MRPRSRKHKHRSRINKLQHYYKGKADCLRRKVGFEIANKRVNNLIIYKSGIKYLISGIPCPSLRGVNHTYRAVLLGEARDDRYAGAVGSEARSVGVAAFRVAPFGLGRSY